MMRLLTFVTAMALGTAAYATDFTSYSDSQLRGVVNYTDSQCRGGAGDATDYMCAERDAAWEAFAARGYCPFHVVANAEIKDGWKRCKTN